jgi:CHAT domain-containing protein
MERSGLAEPAPLPGAQREVRAIAALLREHHWLASARTGTEATETAVKALHAPAVLHIATHGYFLAGAAPSTGGRAAAVVFDSAALEAMPLLRSGLLLAGAGTTLRTRSAPDSGDDGLLTAQEAMDLDLDGTDLVVLSACETGRGSVRAGEGVYGLQRSFRVAGAHTVLMSLWSVSDDITGRFMEIFYREWLRTGDAHAAVATAQQTVRRAHPDPYSWAPFVVAGD